MTSTEIISILTTGILVVSIVFTQWRSGAKQISTEVMENYETLVEQLREQNKEQASDHQRQITEVKTQMQNMEKGLIAKIAKLEGVLQEKDTQLKTLQQILANRNPELEAVLGEIRDFMRSITDSNKHQTQILEAGQTRERIIDSSTEAQKGNVLRK